VTIVGNEPRLAARLLQMANSAAFNPSGRPLTDLRSAITRLGYQVVQSAAVGYAVQQMKYAGPLRSIAKPLSELWKECVSVASVSQAVARRTTVSPDEAFLTGLLHGIGRLYIMVRAMGHAAEFGNDQVFLDMVSDWHAPIGKAVLENWGFAEEMCNAVGEQHDYDRRWIRGGELSDILIASVVLAAAMKNPVLPADTAEGISAFQHLGLTVPDCDGILADAFTADLIDGAHHRRSLDAAARVGIRRARRASLVSVAHSLVVAVCVALTGQGRRIPVGGREFALPGDGAG
jgi:HD-like signal output (HDOD) protein